MWLVLELESTLTESRSQHRFLFNANVLLPVATEINRWVLREEKQIKSNRDVKRIHCKGSVGGWGRRCNT